MQTDVLIVGSGCAGLYCALNLPKDKNILMITKDIVEHSDSYLAQGGMCMLKDPDDFDSYFYDTMKAGHFENDTAAVETMIKESPDLVKDLLSYGVDFQRDEDGNLAYTREGAHARNRIVYHEDITDIGGTLRLGSYPCHLDTESLAYKLYGEELIHERHRHRYEVNNDYREALTSKGMKLSGISPDGRIVEMIEIPSHPFFIATQAHPELKSRPNRPHPLFLGFVNAAIEKGKQK